MTDIFRDGRFQPDDWRLLGADEAVPAEGGVILTEAQWQAARESLAGSNAPLGLLLQPASDLDDLAADFPRFAVIALTFPKFADGRGFSQARLLRDRHGYEGEIRAVGDVLIDLVPFMFRVGITTLVVENEPTRQQLTEGSLPLVPFFYQPAADDAVRPEASRPWLRRAAVAT